jgi:hypothetical protein
VLDEGVVDGREGGVVQRAGEVRTGDLRADGAAEAMDPDGHAGNAPVSASGAF